MLNPPVSVRELHLTFVLWRKLQGHNNGGGNYGFQLLEYQDICSRGIPNNQLGRIYGVRGVGDSKTYGDSFIHDGEELTYIRSGLCMPDREMEPFEGLFNQFSQELRRRIHIDGLDPEEVVTRQLTIARQLTKASIYLRDKDFQRASQVYESLSHLTQQPRILALGGILFDNFALEQLVGGVAANRAREDDSYWEGFLKKFESGSFDLFREDGVSVDLAKDMVYGADFNSNTWQHNFSAIHQEVSSDNLNLAAYLMQCMVRERMTMYQSKVVKLFNRIKKKKSRA